MSFETRLLGIAIRRVQEIENDIHNLEKLRKECGSYSKEEQIFQRIESSKHYLALNKCIVKNNGHVCFRGFYSKFEPVKKPWIS